MPRVMTHCSKKFCRSFTSQANWLPRNLPHWTGPEHDRKLYLSRRCEYLTHPQLELARVLNDEKGGDLNLLSKYSPSMVTTGITVTREDWLTHSAFLVICFEPDTIDHTCWYSRWTGLDCRVVWGHKLSYTKTTPFSSLRTSIDESVAEKGAGYSLTS